MEILVLVAALAGLGVAARFLGADSREAYASVRYRRELSDEEREALKVASIRF